MGYVIDPAGRVPDEVRRIAYERIDEAIAALDDLGDTDRDAVETGVHDARKRCKEVRALARLVRSEIGSEYRRFNCDVRDAADTLSPIRDSHAVLATLDELRSGRAGATDPSLDAVRAGQAAAASGETSAVADGDPRITSAITLLSRARTRIERWTIDDDVAVLEVGLADTYRRGRRAFRRARREPTDEHVHEWRKAVKHLWYQVRLIERSAPSLLTPLVATLDDLAEALGDDHDLAVLIERMAAHRGRFGGKNAVKRATKLARAEQDELRRRAFRLASTVYAETPDAFTTRMITYWTSTRREGPELPTGGIADLVRTDRGDRTAPSSTPSAAPGTIERERKFLVDELPELIGDGTVLRQGYLAIDGTVSVRVRNAGPQGCTLTLKAGRGAVRTEIEVLLDDEQFASAWQHTGDRRVHKTRHHLDADGHRVDLDVFHDELDGLVVAEVEFDSEEAMASFRPPGWFGTDVTDDDRYTNASLALRGAPDGDPPQR